MIDIRFGNCHDIIKEMDDESVDMILTDPPYGISYQSSRRKVKAKPIYNDGDISWIDSLASEFYRVSKKNTAHYVFCSYHNIDKFKLAFERYFKVKNILTWVKNNASMGDLTADFAPKTEFVLFLQKGRKLINGKRSCNVLEYKKTGNKLHPTQKPVDMLEFMITKFSNDGDIVFDPCMGSGSTGEAGVHTNRKFIGIEIDKDYFNIAERRLINAKHS